MLKHIIDGRGNIQTVSVPTDPAEEMTALMEIMRLSEQMGRDKWLKTLDPEFARSIEPMLSDATVKQAPAAHRQSPPSSPVAGS